MLEIVCDGGSRLPRRGPESTTLHLCAASSSGRARRAPTFVEMRRSRSAPARRLRGAPVRRRLATAACRSCPTRPPSSPRSSGCSRRRLLVASRRGEGAVGGPAAAAAAVVATSRRRSRCELADGVPAEERGGRRAGSRRPTTPTTSHGGLLLPYSAVERLDVHELLGAGARAAHRRFTPAGAQALQPGDDGQRAEGSLPHALPTTSRARRPPPGLRRRRRRRRPPPPPRPSSRASIPRRRRGGRGGAARREAGREEDWRCAFGSSGRRGRAAAAAAILRRWCGSGSSTRSEGIAQARQHRPRRRRRLLEHTDVRDRQGGRGRPERGGRRSGSR